MKHYRWPVTALSCCVFLLAGCQESDAPVAAAQEQLVFGTPLEPRLHDVYMRTCRNCHMNDVPGIPRAGDAADWQVRRNKGLDTLTRNAINGFRGMPPMGLCNDCGEADFRALVAYMAGLELDAPGGPQD